MMLHELTYNLEQITGKALPNVPVDFRLERPDRLPPESPKPGRFVPTIPAVTSYSDDNSSGSVMLEPTTNYVGRARYIASIPGYGDIPFIMPDSNC